MTETPKPTPAPWAFYVETNRPCGKRVILAHSRILAHVPRGDNAKERAEFDANGALLAAAPDLLAACLAARAHGSQGDTEDGTSVSYLLDRAIALARGAPR
jgi:hypothetical protein